MLSYDLACKLFCMYLLLNNFIILNTSFNLKYQFPHAIITFLFSPRDDADEDSLVEKLIDHDDMHILDFGRFKFFLHFFLLCHGFCASHNQFFLSEGAGD